MNSIVGASQLQLYALTTHIIRGYQHKTLLILWNDHMRNTLPRKQYMIYMMLVEAYHRKCDYEAQMTMQYMIIHNYIRYHSDLLVRQFIMR
jgi:hypothetical protein